MIASWDQALSNERIKDMSDTNELLHANLHDVFSERDPHERLAAIERTYAEDVKFIDPEGEVVGLQALNDRAQKLLDDAPADFVLEENGPPTSVLTPPPCPSASARRAVPRSVGSTSSRCVMAVSASCAHCSRPTRLRDQTYVTVRRRCSTSSLP
jgi:hypothetical protein